MSDSNEKNKRNNLIMLARKYGATEIEIASACNMSKQAVSQIIQRLTKRVVDRAAYGVHVQVACRQCGNPRNLRKETIQQCPNCLDGTYLS